MCKLQYVFLFFLLPLASIRLYADDGKLYTADNMSSSRVSCVTQDKYGFIWVGTSYGLNRFDGYQFVKYFTEANDTASLVSNEVSNFLVDGQDRLWIGCRKGLVRYCYENDSFRRYDFPGGITPRVTALVEDKAGNVFIGTSGYGLYVIKAGQEHVSRPTYILREDMEDFVTDLYVDANDMLWCACRSSRLLCFGNAERHEAKVRAYTTDCGDVVCFENQDQRGFLVVCKHGVNFYDIKAGRFLSADYDLSALSTNYSISDAAVDHLGNLYLATSGMGLMVVPAGSRRLQAVENVSLTFDLSTANLEQVFEDNSNNLWLCCNKRGLFQLRRSEGAFQNWSFSRQNVKLGSSVSSIAPGKANDLLCVVQKTGVYLFSQEGKIVRQLKAPEAPISIFKDCEDNYWLGTETALYAYNPVGETWTQKLIAGGMGVACIAEDAADRLFLGVDGKGLIVYDKKTGHSEAYSMVSQDKGNGVLVNDWIRALCFDSRGLLWIGTVSGVGCFDPHNHSFRPLGWDALFRGSRCYAISESSGGDMLIGSEEGLYRYERQSGKYELLPGADELQNKSIYTIVTDNSGDLWMSTANGIWHYDMRRRALDSFVYGDGLDQQEFVVGARHVTPDGRIMFANYDGITAFFPHQVKNNGVQIGEVFLTNFTVNGKRLDARKRHFELSYNENTFVMEFSLLDFRKTTNTTFLYKINNGEWTEIPEGTRVVSFNKMKSGTYDIEVKAVSNGAHSLSDCKIQVVVRPPFYLSWWALVCYVLALLTVVAALLFYYDRKRKKKFDEDRMKFLINTTHDIRSPLTLILSPLKKLKSRNLDENAQNDLNVIEHSAQRILTLVNQILDVRKIDKNQMKLHCRKTDLVDFINVVFKHYEYNANERNIKLSFEHPASPVWVWIDRTQFDKVIYNLLSNAFKFTFDRGNIDIRISQIVEESKEDNHEYVQLTVTDNGSGMRNEIIPHIFDRFYQGKSSKASHVEGTGIGLNLCKMIVDMHHGSISAANRTDGVKGSVFTVKLPVGCDHLSQEEIDQSDEHPAVIAVNGKKKPKSNYHVLVVDDDEEIGRYIAEELGDYYYFTLCQNGRDGIRELLEKAVEAQNPYDVVVSDVMMPEMDGFTMLRLIKTNANISHIPVIMLTSKTDVANRLEGLEKGADAYLTKPFVMDELHLTIDNLIANHLRLKGVFSGASKQTERVENITVKGNDEQLMDRIMKSVNLHLGNSEFTVDILCEEVGISHAHLHRKMKELTGLSPSEFIRNIRLEQAARLLAEQKLNVTQVAYAVGFNTQSHFSTVFRKHFGKSPRDFIGQ